jgi:hypothetical protein
MPEFIRIKTSLLKNKVNTLHTNSAGYMHIYLQTFNNLMIGESFLDISSEEAASSNVMNS